MIILTQSGNIVYFDNVSGIEKKNIRCSDDYVNIVAYAVGKDDGPFVLGRYPEEEADDIIVNICDRYNYLCQNQAQNNGIAELDFVFKMPAAKKTEKRFENKDVIQDTNDIIFPAEYLKYLSRFDKERRP